MDRFLLWPRLVIHANDSINIVECEKGFYDKTNVLKTDDDETYITNIVLYKNHYVMKCRYHLYIYDKNYCFVKKHWWGPCNDFEIVGEDIIRTLYSYILISPFDKLGEDASPQNIELGNEIKVIKGIEDNRFMSYTKSGMMSIYGKRGERYEREIEKQISSYRDVKIHKNELYGLEGDMISVYNMKLENLKTIWIMKQYAYTMEILNARYVYLYWIGNVGRILDIEKERLVIGIWGEEAQGMGEEYFCMRRYDGKEIEFHEIDESGIKLIKRYAHKEGVIKGLKMLPVSEEQRKRLCERLGEELRMSMDLLGVIVDYCGMW